MRNRCAAGRLVDDALVELGHGEKWLVEQVTAKRETAGRKPLGRGTLWRWMVGKSAPRVIDARFLAEVLGKDGNGEDRVPVTSWGELS